MTGSDINIAMPNYVVIFILNNFYHIVIYGLLKNVKRADYINYINEYADTFN